MAAPASPPPVRGCTLFPKVIQPQNPAAGKRVSSFQFSVFSFQFFEMASALTLQLWHPSQERSSAKN
jgi:hypothetical protein